MLTPPKPPEQGKIRLPRAEAKPDWQLLEQMMQQAGENRPREVELIWSNPAKTKTYCLDVNYKVGAKDPTWILWEDNGDAMNIAWNNTTSQIQMLDDVMHMLDGGATAAPSQPAQQTANSNPFGQPAQANQPQVAAAVDSGKDTGIHAYFGEDDSKKQKSAFAASPHSAAAGYNEDGTMRGVSSIDDLTFKNRSKDEGPYEKKARAEGIIEGNLDDIEVPDLINNVASSARSGRLEVIGEEMVGEIFFENGMPKHAATPNAYGDAAIKEMVTWDKGTYAFVPDARTTMISVKRPLPETIGEGRVRADQKKHLKRAGLTFESFLLPKQKNLSDTELRLMLTKGEPLDYDFQRDIYRYLQHKRTFLDLLRDKPMNSEKWTMLLYNFLSCGLIEIKQAESRKGTVLDFLGDEKGQVEEIQSSFTRPETGIYHSQALLFFLQYEYFRYEAYNFPLSLIVFEMQKKRDEMSQIVDLLSPEAANAAAMRIDLVKRPLDTLGHFETIDYALLLPNTTASSAAFLANRMYEVLTASPLAKGHDRSTLLLSFGVASLPADGQDLQTLINSAKAAKEQAKIGTFPVVLFRHMKKG